MFDGLFRVAPITGWTAVLLNFRFHQWKPSAAGVPAGVDWTPILSPAANDTVFELSLLLVFVSDMASDKAVAEPFLYIVNVQDLPTPGAFVISI